MRDTGIVRKIDELGRIVLPIELRREMGIEEKDTLSILIDGEHIVLKKHSPSCFICPRFYVSTSKSIIKALINMRSFEIQLSPIG